MLKKRVTLAVEEKTREKRSEHTDSPSISGKRFAFLILREGEHLCLELNLLTIKTRFSKAMYMKAMPATVSGIMLNMHDTQKKNVHYLQMCSKVVLSSFFGISNKREARGFSRVIISMAASPLTH